MFTNQPKCIDQYGHGTLEAPLLVQLSLNFPFFVKIFHLVPSMDYLFFICLV
jgi:hypothetical protein